MRRQVRVALSAVTAVAAILALFAAQASAGYVEVGTFANNGSGPGGSGAEPGQLSDPGQAEVRDSNGNLYVADTANNRVQVFTPTPTGGEFSAAAAIASPTGLAIDQATGDVYVAGPAGISKLDSTLSPVGTWTDPGVTGNLAVDPATGDLLVADTAANLVRRYNPDGSADGSFAAERPVDLAGTPTGQILVITSTGPMPGECEATSSVVVFSGAGVQEGTVGASLTAPGAVAVDPDGGTIAIASVVNEYFCNGPNRPQINFFDATATATGTVGLVGDTLYASVPGLAVAGGRAYAVTKSPRNDSFGNTKIVALELKEDPPSVESAWAKSVSVDSAQLRAEVNPEGDDTTYHFEYGLADCAASVCFSYPVPEAELAAALEPKAVGVGLSGLQPDTTYHFRVVASNEFGTSESADATFRTRSEVAGPSLPEGRAWELVSEPNKGDYDVVYGSGFAGSYSISASDGEALGYTSFGAFADSKGAPILNQYIADRTGSGWNSRSMSVAQTPQLLNFQRFFVLSEDMSRGVVANKIDTAPGAPGLYVSDLSDGALVLALAKGGTGTDFVTGTPSFDTVVFENWLGLDPEAPPFPGHVIFRFAAGQATIASRLPNGTVAASGRIGDGAGAQMWSRNARALSADGSRLFFRGVDPAISEKPSVYLRENGTTVRISASQQSTPQPPSNPAQFQGASKDGSVAYFVSGDRLTDDSVAESESNADLYRYDVASGELIDLTTPDPDGGGMGGMDSQVWAVSEDGGLVYFTSFAQLAPGAPNDFSQKLYVYDASDQSTTLIGAIAINYLTQPTLSKDGRKLAFLTNARIGSYDNAGSAQMYVYDQEAKTLACASCNPSGARPTGGASGQPPIFGPYTQREGRQARIISWDGSVVVFTTPDALVQHDTNETGDVYVYRDGRAHLVSSGQGRAESNLADMSPDGRDVFFATRDRLVGIDQDNAYDIYDARIGGGIAAQTPSLVTPCTGTDCQGQPSLPPAPPVVNTNGAGEQACTGSLIEAARLQSQARALRGKAGRAKSPKRAKSLRKKAADLTRQSNRARQCGKGGGG